MNTSADNHDDGSELQAVMGAYFDALLHEAALKPVEAKQAVVPDACADLKSTAMAVEPLPAVVLPALADPVNVTASTASEIPDIDCEPQASAAPAYQLIQVGGLTLGIPLGAIDGITALPTTTALDADAPAWALGSYVAAQEMLTVVDTAALLVPNNARHISTHGNHIVRLKGQRWALACDAIGVVLTPDPGQVTWRGAEGKRLWLAGTLRTPSCALLDIAELIKLLAR